MATAEKGPLRAGAAQRDITPPPGLAMSGFLIRNGPAAAVGIHDPLFVGALAAADGRSTVLLLTYDLIGLPAEWIESTRKQVARACGVPPACQMYSCSHTHCGPGTGVLPYVAADMPHVMDAYMEKLAEHTAAAAREAVRALEPVELAIGAGSSFAGWNRRSAEASPSGPCDGDVDDIDPTVVVAQLAARNDRPVATLVNYGCHATSSRDSFYSSDYVGFVRSTVEATTGSPCFYVNGAGGDVNPRGAGANRSFEIAQATGERLGQDALAALSRAKPSGSALVAAETAVAELVYADLISADAAQRLRAEGVAALERAADEDERTLARPRLIDYADRVLAARSDPAWLRQKPVEVQALRIGDLAVVAFPVEFFSADGREVRSASPAPFPVVAGWSNGLWGYTPTRRAFEHGGYEPENAFRYYGHPAAWAPVSGDNLRAAALQAATRLFASKAA